jgi:GTP cyclohydrolase IA
VLARRIPVRSVCEHHLLPFVGVVIDAEHSCMTLRGVQAAGSTTVTSTLLGALRNDARSRQEFFALAGVNL